ncbi:cell division cycle-associated protein 7-like [Macrosteles quadrilineatus]|uniref:cell division cycle-associated protein 7-like n=1 Tax=Macrosteles quadrilineatus TaxID=74068 RepID=UPI0023E34A36|nr:cell division cycle-associated protein 7-like [Macrosteles quadrilineatus]
MAADRDSLSEYELLRLKNIQENTMMMIKLGIFKAQDQNTTPVSHTRTRSSRQPLPKKSMRIKTKENISPPVSVKRRRSNRIAEKQLEGVEFADDIATLILGNENICFVNYCSDEEESDNDRDRVVQTTKRRKVNSTNNNRAPRDIPSVDDITEDDLKRVAEGVRDKVYSEDGTTCHQCRQKTLDMKTYCRSENCYGVRGQFCGPCLKNRYGELVVEALKDPKWSCPPCRELCNCSICRTQKGKTPTGQLFYLAQERGYKSVRDFLEKETEIDEM